MDSEYDIRTFYKSGNVRSSRLICSKDSFDAGFCESVRGQGRVDKILRIRAYKDGELIEGELPPVWVNHQGYIFSQEGLKKTIPFDASKHDRDLADYFVNDACKGLDSFCDCLSMEKLYEESCRTGVRNFQFDNNGRRIIKENEVFQTTPQAIPLITPTSRHKLEGALYSLLFELEGKSVSRDEIFRRADEKGILNLMKGPFKKFRLWHKLTFGLYLSSNGDSYLYNCIGVERDSHFKGRVYRVERLLRGD